MLETRIRLHVNPWPETIGDDLLVALIQRVADKRAEHIEKMVASGEYTCNSLGLAIMDPTAAPSTPSTDALLATIAIGPEGDRFVPNAIAKACHHRDMGLPAGYGVYMDLTRTADGDFCYGYSTQVDGTIAAASGQSELADGCEAGHAVVSFNYFVQVARRRWREDHPHQRWFGSTNLPGERYAMAAMQFNVIHDSKRGKIA